MISSDASILIVGESECTLSLIGEGLREFGYNNLTTAPSIAGLAAVIERIHPKAIIVEVGSSGSLVQDAIFQLCRALFLPMVMFVDSSDEALTQSAIEAGVAAYIVDGLKKERVKPILELAISRFEERSRMLCELEKAQSELQDRKAIERAKGFLMQSKGVSEEQAYGLMRKTAMNQNRKVRDIANILLVAADLLK
ncbi:MAG: ANTAR domain-containing protein [Hyphomicrobiales bacterium]